MWFKLDILFVNSLLFRRGRLKLEQFYFWKLSLGCCFFKFGCFEKLSILSLGFQDIWNGKREKLIKMCINLFVIHYRLDCKKIKNYKWQCKNTYVNTYIHINKTQPILYVHKNTYFNKKRKKWKRWVNSTQMETSYHLS